MSEINPRDLPQKARTAHTDDFLDAAEKAGFPASAIKAALMLIDAPPNLRFLGAVTTRLQLLLTSFPSLARRLSDERADDLESIDVVLDAIDALPDSDMRYELMASPADYPQGNLHYSSESHPIYSLLMLRLPHAAHAHHFDALIAATAVAWLGRLEELDWDTYHTNLFTSESDTESNARLLRVEDIRRFYDVEFRLRKLAGLTVDAFKFLDSDCPPFEIDRLLEAMQEARYHATYHVHIPRVANRINSLLYSDHENESGGDGDGRKAGLSDGYAIGTLIAGPYQLSAVGEDNDNVDYIVTSISRATLKRAADEDIDPLELVDDDASVMLDLGPVASLPRSARSYSAAKTFQQISRAQQMTPFREDGLKSWRIDGINHALAAAPQHLSPEENLLLIASLATGRRITRLGTIDVTVDTPADGRVAAIELDLTSRTWRIAVNQPNLRNRPCPDGAITVTQTAVLPDLFGACDVARRCPSVLSGLESGRMRVPVSATRERAAAVSQLLASSPAETPVTPNYLATAIPKAIYEYCGDLAAGALISTWLPCNASTYLHYLTVDRVVIADRYRAAIHYLEERYGLEVQSDTSDIPVGHVGTTNCPTDIATRRMVITLKDVLETLPTKTREQRLRYANIYTCYTVLYLAIGLGFRARRDPRPNVEPLPGIGVDGAIASFFDKATSASHYRTIYCPPALRRHLEHYDTFRESLPYLIAPTGNANRFHRKLVDLLFVYFDSNGYPQELRPIHVERMVSDFFPFKLNCQRRRIRSRMLEYAGDDFRQLGRGFSIWMGHWPQFNSPHRAESGFDINILRRISEAIIEPILESDGWEPLEHRL